MKTAVEIQGQAVLVTYKGSEEFERWLRSVSDSLGLPLTNTIDFALREFAERRGLSPMPARHAPRAGRRRLRAQSGRAATVA
jgi:hypothetical protein